MCLGLYHAGKVSRQASSFLTWIAAGSCMDFDLGFSYLTLAQGLSPEYTILRNLASKLKWTHYGMTTEYRVSEYGKGP